VKPTWSPAILRVYPISCCQFPVSVSSVFHICGGGGGALGFLRIPEATHRDQQVRKLTHFENTCCSISKVNLKNTSFQYSAEKLFNLACYSAVTRFGHGPKQAHLSLYKLKCFIKDVCQKCKRVLLLYTYTRYVQYPLGLFFFNYYFALQCHLLASCGVKIL
jgi:hypothetical protein